MSEFLKNHYVKTRKEHSCVWCSEVIEKGESALYQAYITDDRESIQGQYWHKECDKACENTDWSFSDDGLIPDAGSHKRGEPIDWENY